MEIVLASSSPRRRELIKQIISDYVVDFDNVEESFPNDVNDYPPHKKAAYLAYIKGEAVAKRRPNDFVISADTIVYYDGQILGKPKDKEDAKRILRFLNNKRHEVCTGISLHYKGEVLNAWEISYVTFNDLSEELIESYVNSGSPLDKAGAYGFQDNKEFPIVKEVEGDINNIIGLPTDLLKEKILLFIEKEIGKYPELIELKKKIK